MSSVQTIERPAEDAGFRKHTISLLVANIPGVLIRIALVFARRGYNIDSLVVSPTVDEHYSMMNIVASGDERTLDQILKQLNKLVDVVHASDRQERSLLQRELAIIKLSCTREQRPELLQLATALKCEPIDMDDESLILQTSGSSARVDGVIHVLEEYDVIELVRSGKILMARGSQRTV